MHLEFMLKTSCDGEVDGARLVQRRYRTLTSAEARARCQACRRPSHAANQHDPLQKPL